VSAAVGAFRATFPRNARPSSRAAFLFECVTRVRVRARARVRVRG